MRKITFTRPDGGLSVVHPVRNTLGETLTTDAEIEQRAWDKLPADAINPQFVEADTVPTDRTFRNAWKADLTVDLPKAREITKDRLRAERTPLLADLDVQFMRALEVAGDTTAIAAEKQRLRDVTTLADTATTVDDLRSIKADHPKPA